MEQLEKCVRFYSKEVMPLKEGAIELENYVSRLVYIFLILEMGHSLKTQILFRSKSA